MTTDLAVIGQDPRFGGGYRSQVEAFCLGAVALSRTPHLHYASLAHGFPSLRRRPAFRSREESWGAFAGTAYPAFVPELAPVNVRVTGRRIARRIGRYRSRWVVATSAPFGAAARGRTPYACWIGTDLESEWESRRRRLQPSRRAALALGARDLRRLEVDVLRGAAHVYATTPSSRDRVAAAGGITVGILPIPVDVSHFSPEPDSEWLARAEEPVIAFVGRAADPRKNVRLLLDALPLLRLRVPGARVLLIGERPTERLPAAVEATGPVADVAPLLRQATLFVLPSLQEGFGIVAAEALASGVPAIVTPSGGPDELIERSGGGIRLSTFEVEELVETAAALLGDAERLATMRQAGRAYVVREHGQDRFKELLAAAFHELDG